MSSTTNNEESTSTTTKGLIAAGGLLLAGGAAYLLYKLTTKPSTVTSSDKPTKSTPKPTTVAPQQQPKTTSQPKATTVAPQQPQPKKATSTTVSTSSTTSTISTADWKVFSHPIIEFKHPREYTVQSGIHPMTGLPIIHLNDRGYQLFIALQPAIPDIAMPQFLDLSFGMMAQELQLNVTAKGEFENVPELASTGSAFIELAHASKAANVYAVGLRDDATFAVIQLITDKTGEYPALKKKILEIAKSIVLRMPDPSELENFDPSLMGSELQVE